MRLIGRVATLSTACIFVCCCFAQQLSDSAPRDQLQQYVTQLQANPTDDALRTKIIQLAQQLQPPPAIPPEADELAGRAQYIFEHANSPDDLVKAAQAFEKVALAVPWLPDYYFDAAVAYEKANDPANALKDYRWSLLAYPQDSQDAKKVREEIGALIYVLEQQQQLAKEAESRRQAEVLAEQQRREAAERARMEQSARDEVASREWAGVWRFTGRKRAGVHWTFEVRDNELITTAVVDRPALVDGAYVGQTVISRYHLNGRTATAEDSKFRLVLNDQGDTITQFYGENAQWGTLTRAGQ